MCIYMLVLSMCLRVWALACYYSFPPFICSSAAVTALLPIFIFWILSILFDVSLALFLAVSHLSSHTSVRPQHSSHWAPPSLSPLSLLPIFCYLSSAYPPELSVPPSSFLFVFFLTSFLFAVILPIFFCRFVFTCFFLFCLLLLTFSAETRACLVNDSFWFFFLLSIVFSFLLHMSSCAHPLSLPSFLSSSSLYHYFPSSLPPLHAHYTLLTPVFPVSFVLWQIILSVSVKLTTVSG